MYFTNKTILLLLIIVLLIVIINIIIKTIKTIKTREVKENYQNGLIDSPYPILNKVINDFNKIYDKKINPAIGLRNFIKNYY